MSEPFDTARARPAGRDAQGKVRTKSDEVASVFAATCVLARRGAGVDPRRLRRLARALVRAAEGGDAAFLGLTTLAEAQRDRASRTAHLALLCIGAAREITTSRRALARLALTVLVADLGAPPDADEDLEPPSDARAVPATSAAAVIALFGARPSALAVADAAFVAAWLRRRRALGPLEHDAMNPHVAARIIHVARAYLDRVAPPDGSPGVPPLVALTQVAALTSIDPAAFRCLVRSLGSTPAGMVLELETGEWAVVVPPSSAEDPLDRPVVRVLTDPMGRPRQPPIEIDLADPSSEGRRALRVVDPWAASGYAAAAFLGS